MSGITLMFSGIVLISNGLNYLDKVEDNSNALINIFTGLLYIFLNVMICVHGIFAEKDSTYYYTAISGLLFGYTYLSYGVNRIKQWDNRNLGYFSIFVTFNSIFFAVWILMGNGGNYWDVFNWIMWGYLWATNYFSHNLGRKYGDWLYYLTIFAGVVTCWIPALLILTGNWPSTLQFQGKQAWPDFKRKINGI